MILIKDLSISTESYLRILGVTLDKKFTFEPHVNEMLKKVFAKVSALRKIRRLVPMEIMIKLYKAYVLPHFDYCCPLLLGIRKCLNNKLEKANYYVLKTPLRMGNSTSYESLMNLATMNSLEQRRYEHSLIIAFKSNRLQGPIYIYIS